MTEEELELTDTELDELLVTKLKKILEDTKECKD